MRNPGPCEGTTCAQLLHPSSFLARKKKKDRRTRKQLRPHNSFLLHRLHLQARPGSFLQAAADFLNPLATPPQE
ncbi:hypothetical protein MCOR07_010400 [Pyricularia oryzae]|nr:hypothetical protein MCOR07_010400 [Pyricularia oryzae]